MDFSELETNFPILSLLKDLSFLTRPLQKRKCNCISSYEVRQTIMGSDTCAFIGNGNKPHLSPPAQFWTPWVVVALVGLSLWKPLPLPRPEVVKALCTLLGVNQQSLMSGNAVDICTGEEVRVV